MDLEELIKTRIKNNNGLYKLFTDKIGGCWVMAQALKKFLGEGELYTVVDEGVAKYIVLSVGNDFVNAGGVKDASKLLNDLKKEKKLVDPHLRSFKILDIPGAPDPKADDFVNKVVAYFKGEKSPVAEKTTAVKVAEKPVAKPVVKPEKPVAKPVAKSTPAKPVVAAKPEVKIEVKSEEPISVLAKARADKIASRQAAVKK